MSERRELDGLPVRTRIGETLPAMFQDDDMAQRWCDGLDDVIAPVPATLDNLWAYLDPALAPIDFVEWLAGWVGLELDQTWDEQRRRELVARAHRLYDFRGTAGGLADLIELYTGVRPEIIDGGGVVWSPTPDAPMPGSADGELVVRLDVSDVDGIDEARLENMVEMSKPAHVVHRIEIAGDNKPAATKKTTKKTTATKTPSPPPPSSQPPPPPPDATPAEPPGATDAEEPENADVDQSEQSRDDREQPDGE
jgi:phage tail-like protein